MSVDHDLTPEELAFLIAKTPSGKSAWISTSTASHPCIEHDGREIIVATAATRNGKTLTTAEIIRSIYNAVSRQYAKRKQAAAKAAATRTRRHDYHLYRVARAYQQNQLHPTTHCELCHKALTDPVSRARGIGPECFESVLQMIERDINPTTVSSITTNPRPGSDCKSSEAPNAPSD